MAKRVLMIIASLLTLSSVAKADCYDVFGCSDRNYFRAQDLSNGPNCEFLWEMRNGIYAQRGYCFHSRRGIETMGNDRCRFYDVDEVPLNRYERANVATISSVESAMGCKAQ